MSDKLDRLDKQNKLDKQEKYRLWIEAPSSRALAAAVSDRAEASIAAGFSARGVTPSLPILPIRTTCLRGKK